MSNGWPAKRHWNSQTHATNSSIPSLFVQTYVFVEKLMLTWILLTLKRRLHGKPVDGLPNYLIYRLDF